MAAVRRTACRTLSRWSTSRHSGLIAVSAFQDVMGVPAWKSLPSWFLVAEGDQAIPPDAAVPLRAGSRRDRDRAILAAGAGGYTTAVIGR